MARRKVAWNPLFIMIAMAVAVIALAPKWVWGLLVVGAIAALIVWKIFKAKQQALLTQQDIELSSFTTLPASGGEASLSILPSGRASSSMQNNQTNHKSSAQKPSRNTSRSASMSKNDEEDFASFSLSDSPSSSSYRIPPPPLDPAADYRWIPLGQTTSIAGFEIKGGMIYVGTGLNAAYGQPDPALINPKLKVMQKASIDISQRLTDYWPSYSEITPEARRSYLQWLASGRSDPSANIGYVFLFFYGLERRILIDAKDDPVAQAEIPVIQGEIIRLLGIYSENASFNGYVSNLLNYIDATLPLVSMQNDQFLEDIIAENPYELPLKLKIGLGQLVVAEKPIPANWALAWAISDPNISKRTPVSRCQSQFAQLFIEKYQEAYNSGLILRKNKTKLMFSYWPASNGLRGVNFQQSWSDLPDVTAVKTPINKLQELVDKCTETLEPYSRFVGRNTDKADSLEALLLLPVHLWSYKFQHLLRQIRRETQAQPELIAWAELLSLFGYAEGLNRDKQLIFSQTLQKQGVGIEPDVVLGAKTLKPDDKVALFNITESVDSLVNSSAYQLAVLTVDLACMVAHSDGDFSTQEELFIQNHIDTSIGFSNSLKERLKAHLALSFEQPLSLAALKKKLEPLAPEARHALARLLIQLTQADGVVAPAEIKFLERTYKALGLDSKQLYSDLHAGESRSTVQGVSDRGATQSGSSLINLDMARIDQLRQETAAVTALLSDVFSEEEHIDPKNTVDEIDELMPEAEEKQEVSTNTTLLGLDADHSAFLRLILTRMSWSMEDIESAATDMELMLEGALEQINEAVFDAYDAPLFESGDPVEINQDIVKELTL